MSRHLHIISFDRPYPPGYGGVIDVYYKIRYLHQTGVKVHLHYFQYGRDQCDEASCRSGLDAYCYSVTAYPRKTGWISFLSMTPYIVRSRRSDKLLENLCRDGYPILFEGLHTCHLLGHPRLRDRLLLYRESNIEHHYYRHLASAEPSWIKKLYYLSEALKLRRYEKILGSASALLTVSTADQAYLQSRFPSSQVHLIPSFHRDTEVTSRTGQGTYVLYQGNLSVPENTSAVRWLAEKVWQPDLPQLVIAGKNPPGSLLQAASRLPNIEVKANPDDDEMFALLRDAHVNILLTFQPTGLKLKLLNALYNGRFCLVNRAMLAGTMLDRTCVQEETPEGFRNMVRELMKQPFTNQEIEQRKEILSEHYSNEVSGRRLLEALNSPQSDAVS